MNPVEDRDPQNRDELRGLLLSIRRRLRGLTLAVFVMALTLIISFAAQFGELVNWFAADAFMYGAATAGAALLGFAVGWIARRWA
jgi:hypothetical protein